MQVVAPASVSAYLPLTQLTHTLTPRADEYLPLAHSMQSVSASLPSVAKYLPAAQSMQVVAETATPAEEQGQSL